MVEMSSPEDAKDMFLFMIQVYFTKYVQVDAMYVLVNCSDGVFIVYKVEPYLNLVIFVTCKVYKVQF